MDERLEAILRIIVGIVSGIILDLWKVLILILGVAHFFVALISGKRNKGLADFSEMWNTQIYIYYRYMTFVSNKRPFPFTGLENSMSKFEAK